MSRVQERGSVEMAGSNGVTIIKRKKVTGGEAHHGGAWKVAYADFVTAMMAFFLLMWLLNATTEEQRKGIAEYFSPTVPVSRVSGGGSGALGGDSLFSERTLARNGSGAAGRPPAQARGDQDERDPAEVAARAPAEAGEELGELETLFEGMSGESDRADALLRHIRTRITDEGLIIELFDAPGRPLYATGARPTRRLTALLEMIGGTAALVTNRIAVVGHAESDDGEGRWRVATARADGARQALVAAGVAPERMTRVTGEPEPEAAAPVDPRARRLAITLLRSDL